MGGDIKAVATLDEVSLRIVVTTFQVIALGPRRSQITLRIARVWAAALAWTRTSGSSPRDSVPLEFAEKLWDSEPTW